MLRTKKDQSKMRKLLAFRRLPMKTWEQSSNL